MNPGRDTFASSIQFKYIAMSSIVILFILGATFTLQVEACNIEDAYFQSMEKADEVGEELGDLLNFISRLQSNFIHELIGIKLDATFDDMESVKITIEKLDKGVIQEVTNEGRSVSHCSRLMLFNITYLSRSISMEYNKCVLNQFELLNPVENDIHDFLNELAWCPLNIDPLATLFCTSDENENLTMCIEVNSHHVDRSWLPYECILEQYNPREKRLKADALRLASVGKANAIDCILEFKKRFNADLEAIVENSKECLAQGE